MARKNIKIENIIKRAEKMAKMRDEYIKDIDNIHIKLQQGNSKTGQNCWTVSLIPIIDCKRNCGQCMKNCYDICNVCFMSAVQNDRARNSAVHKADPERFWNEVDAQVKANYVTELRINVGGDLDDYDFAYVAELGRKNPKTMILFFTKNYQGINTFLDNNEFPENVRPIMSAWKDTEMINPHNLPQSHVLWEDGSTTAPEYGAVYCGGNCSECAFKGEGCWTLKKGKHVIFVAH